MKNLFKTFIILFTLFWCITLVAQDVVDRSPNTSPKIPTSNNVVAMWDVLLQFDANALTGAAGNAGCEWDGTYFYSTRWATNLIHKYNATGTTMLEEFSIPGVSGLRDLAFDGTYMYGGAASNTIYQMDFVTKTLIGTITSPVPVRFIAYDEGSDAFWVGDWASPPTLVSRTGATLATITTGFVAQYGAAYDNVSPGGPYLWVFNQENTTGGIPQTISQWDIATGTATGVTHDVMSDVGIVAGNLSIAGGLCSMTDFASGFFTIGGLLQGNPNGDQIFVYEVATTGPPCPVGDPTNPNPANGATDVDINLSQISWTNGAGANNIEVWFDGNMIYTGPPVTSYAVPGPLDYATTYGWKIVGMNDTCSTIGPTWTFTTMQDPNLVITTVDIYPQSADYWTGTCDASTKTEVSYVNCVGSGFAGWMVFDCTPIVNDPSTTITEIMFNGYLYNNNFPYWSITPMGSVNPITGTASDIFTQVSNNVTQGSAYSFNQEPGTMTNGWQQRTLDESTAYADLKAALGQGWFAIGVQDWDAGTTYFVDYEGWAQTNVPYLTVTYQYVTPVELTSFTANANFGVVDLQWITATETNNQGFEVQRSNAGSDFQTIAFVEGMGTTTESQVYTYSDKSVEVGSYTYRLKQIDFDGTTVYSNEIEADVPAPSVFALDQNYPNPFNPSTKINFQLKVDSKVSLKVFDVLGQEVVTLVNSNLVAGGHSINFDASRLNSGVYLYRIEATGVNGYNFVDVKKMILTK